MKIGIVTKWVDEGYTGVGQYTYNLLTHLKKIDNKNEYTLIHLKKSDDLLYKKSERWSDILIPRLPSVLWVVSENLFIKKIAKNFDIIHEPFIGLFMRMNCKTVITIHDLIPRMKGSKVPISFKLYFRYLMPRALKLADGIIANSENTKKDLHRYYDIEEKKIAVIHHGVEKIEPSEENIEKTKKMFDIEYPYILSVGTTYHTKNLPNAIRAFSKFKKRKAGEKYKFIIAGKRGSDYKNILKIIRELGLKEEVILTAEHKEYLKNEEIASLYKLSSLLIFPSLYEGFGFPPLEAMAHNIPVIASRAASIPEVVGDAAIFFEPTNIEEIANAIEIALIDNEIRNKLIKRGQERIKLFTWDRCARETLDWYENVAT
ncbi:MAG: glycosyltransferase family 1 protein [Candidatus Thermoplasmatota archaeon]